MIAALALAAVQFATAMHEDPITKDRQAVFFAEDDGNALMLRCRPGKDELSIDFLPKHYRGAAKYVFAWQPRADSRFGNQESAERDSWAFGDRMLGYTGEDEFGLRDNAQFIDHLARNTVFHIRYQARPDDTETRSIEYSLDLKELQLFIWACNPKRVIRHLREMNSIAAPPESWQETAPVE